MVRMPINTKPLLMVGQDEAMFKQFQFIGKAWTLTSGEKGLVPKDDGQGVMLSSYVSRELGRGLTLTEEDLDRENGKDDH